MKKIKFMHTADLHIGLDLSFLEKLNNKRRAQVLAGFRQIIDISIKEDIDIILIAGDFIEADSISPLYIEEIKNLLASTKAKVYIVAGNHDYISYGSPYLDQDWPENVHIFRNNYFERIDFESVSIYGASFTETYQRKSFDFEVDVDADRANIMLVHGDLEDRLSIYNPIDKLSNDYGKMDYIALGHIHKSSDIGLNNKAIYPGNPVAQSFSTLGPRSVILGQIDDKDINIERKYLDLPNFESVEIDVTDIESFSQICKLFRDQLDKDKIDHKNENYYRLILTGKVDEGFELDFELLRYSLEDFHIIEIIDDTKVAIDLELISQQVSLKGNFTKSILAEIKNARNANDLERVTRLEEILKLGLKALEDKLWL